MPDTLRDLVVNLSLDSDNFAKNIKSVNAQIKEAESEFKAAGAGVNNFETTLDGAQAKATMLSRKLEAQAQIVDQYQRALSAAEKKLQDSYQKHEQLAKALDDAKAKYAALVASEGENSDAAKAQAAEVKKLEGQLSAVNRQMQTNANSVSTATTNLNNAKAALSATQAELKRTNDEITRQTSAWGNASDALKEFSEKASEAGARMTGFGKHVTKYLTAPIAAMGAASVAAFKEVDDGLDIIVTKTGASGKQMEAFQTIFDNIYGRLPATAEEVGTAVGEVNTRFALTGKALEEVSEQFIKFAKINKTDLNGAIDDVDTIMTKFGVDAAEVGNVLGYITSVAQTTGISVSAITGALKSNGSSLIEMGLSLDQAITLLAQFEANGVDASAAIMGLRKAVQEAAKEGVSAGDTVRATVEAIKNAKTESEALQIAMELFGTRGAAEMTSAIRSGRVSVEELSATMSEYGEVVSETFENTLDLPDQAAVAMNKLKIAGREVANSLFTTMAPAVTSLLETIQGLVDRLKDMDEGTRERIVKIAAIAAATGPILTIAGKLTGIIGTVSGALGKFTGAVASAGGGLTGLGAVLKSSPALWMALAAAVAYGAYKLIDYASGAKAAREALEGMNKAADNWKNNSANTFYTASKGLTAFGLSVSNFKSDTAEAYRWLRNLTREWDDELIETDETVQSYVDAFKTATDATRDGIRDLADIAQNNGYDDIYNGMKIDLEELDDIDAQVEALIKKKQETFLTDEDVARLNALIARRQEIDVKYNITPTDKGFDNLIRQTDAAIERAKTAGQDTTEIYQDAMVAAAEGMAEVNKQIDAEYDDRYALVQLMDDEMKGVDGLTDRQRELNRLNEWYAQERLAAGKEYAEALGNFVVPVLDSEEVKETQQTMSELYELLKDWGANPDLQKLSTFTQGLDESQIAEYYAIATQIQNLTSQGMNNSEIAEALGIGEDTLDDLYNAFNQLQLINQQLAQMDTTPELAALKSMFGTSLGEEMIEITTRLNMDGAKADWEAFAKDPGSDVFTDAIVEAYKETEGGADKSGVSDPGGFTALVDGYGKSETFDGSFAGPEDVKALVDAYMRDPKGFESTFEGPSGLLALVKAYAKDPEGFNAYFAAPENLKAIVMAYMADPNFDSYFENPSELKALVNAYLEDPEGFDASFAGPSGLLAFVKAYAEDPNGFDAFFADPSGLSALVKAYAADPDGFDAYFASPEGLLAFVQAYAEVSGGASIDGLKPTVTASISGIDDISSAVISAWRARNGSKVRLQTRLYATVNTVMGDDYKITLSDLMDEGLLKLYDTNGIEIPVTPDVLATVAANALVTGIDENGVYHVIVQPKWASLNAGEEIGNEVNDTITTAIGGSGYKKAKTFKVNARDNGPWQDIIDKGYVEDSWWLKAVGTAGSYWRKANNWVSRGVGLMADIPEMTKEELDELANGIAAVSKTYEDGTVAAQNYGDETITFLREMADAMEAEQKVSGKSQIANSAIATLANYGIQLKASDLPGYLRQIALLLSGENGSDYGAMSEELARVAFASGEMTKEQYEHVLQHFRSNGVTADFDDATASITAANNALRMYAQTVQRMGYEDATDIMGENMLKFFDTDTLVSWKQALTEIDDILEGGGTLSESQQNFMSQYSWLQDMLGTDFLSGIDLSATGDEAGQGVVEAIANAMQTFDFSNAAAGMEGNAESATRGAFEINSPSKKFIPVGESVAEGLAAGITNGTGAVVSAITALANAAVAAAKEALDIHSPSRVFRDEIGKMAMRGFGEGIRAGSVEQAKVVRNAATYLTGEARQSVVNYGGNAVNNYTTNAPINLDGAVFNVREKADIYAIAQQIAALTRRQQSGKGMRR